jgi:large subunit ribosomal protein L22
LAVVSQQDRDIVRAQARYVRSSARKARLVLEHIRGRSAAEATHILAFQTRAVARDAGKVLKSAIANAENNSGFDVDELVVVAAYADEGPTLKRWRPRARGRVNRINKRTCHITIALSPALPGEIKARPERRTRPSAPARPAPQPEVAEEQVAEEAVVEEAPAGEAAKPKARTPRSRKPKAPPAEAGSDAAPPEADAEEPAAEPEATAEPEAEPEPEAAAEPESEADAEPEAEPEPEAATEPAPEREAEPEPEAEPEASNETDEEAK